MITNGGIPTQPQQDSEGGKHYHFHIHKGDATLPQPVEPQLSVGDIETYIAPAATKKRHQLFNHAEKAISREGKSWFSIISGGSGLKFLDGLLFAGAGLVGTLVLGFVAYAYGLWQPDLSFLGFDSQSASQGALAPIPQSVLPLVTEQPTQPVQVPAQVAVIQQPTQVPEPTAQPTAEPIATQEVAEEPTAIAEVSGNEESPPEEVYSAADVPPEIVQTSPEELLEGQVIVDIGDLGGYLKDKGLFMITGPCPEEPLSGLVQTWTEVVVDFSGDTFAQNLYSYNACHDSGGQLIYSLMKTDSNQGWFQYEGTTQDVPVFVYPFIP